jgi:hypothetical protein
MPQILGEKIIDTWLPNGFATVLNSAPSAKKIAQLHKAQDTKVKKLLIALNAVTGACSSIYFALHTRESELPSATPLYEGNIPVTFLGANTILEVDVESLLSSVTLDVGEAYWFVIGNSNATPVTNNFTVFRTTSGNYPSSGASYGKASLESGFREWNGTNWTSVVAGTFQFLGLEWGNGNIFCSPMTSASVAYDSFFATAPTVDVGVEFTVPNEFPSVNISGVALRFSVVRINCGLAIYINRVMVASFPFKSLVVDTTFSNDLSIFKFVSVVANPGDRVAIMSYDVQVGSGQLPWGTQYATNSPWDHLCPAWGTAMMVRRTSDGVWSEKIGVVPAFVVYGQFGNPYSKPLNRRQFNNAR